MKNTIYLYNLFLLFKIYIFKSKYIYYIGINILYIYIFMNIYILC